jgi:hypothetical protein
VQLAHVGFKPRSGAPFRLSVRSTNSQANGSVAPRETMPGSHRARRRGSDARLEAAGRRREESPPPTKPSIAPPSARPLVRPSLIGDASPLLQLERTTPTLTYSVVLAFGAIAVGLGALIAASGTRASGTWFAGTLWFVAVSTLIFSSSMSVVITLSFSRRLRVLADATWRLAQHRSEPPREPPKGDALTSLAQSVTKMAERIAALTSELEQCVEEEQARVDSLVRERTQALARESDDYRRMLGDTKGLLTIDRDGRVVTQSNVLDSWLGSMPRTGPFWEYFERASAGAGGRFESAWARAVGAAKPADLNAMPTSLIVGQRHFALEYKSVVDGDGKLDRILVLLSDVTIPAPDPATTSGRIPT